VIPALDGFRILALAAILALAGLFFVRRRTRA
jgi:LPXTG-motif cell wall-anchored protein